MPLPAGGKVPWPPKDWHSVFSLYAEHAAWYSGAPEDLVRVYDGAIALTSRSPWWKFWSRQRRPGTIQSRSQLHIPLAGDIAATSASLLFAEAPTITIPEAHDETVAPGATPTQTPAMICEERLEEMAAETDLYATLTEAAETNAALGGVFLRICWDRDVYEYPFIDAVQADLAVPEFQYGRLSAVTFFSIVEQAGSVVWRHLERYEKGSILHGLYRGSGEFLGDSRDLAAHDKTKDLQPVVKLPFDDDLAARYIPNMRPNRRFRVGFGSSLGQSDYAGSEGLFDALDEVYTSWMRDIRLAKARIVVPEEYLQRRQTADGIGADFRFDLDQEIFSPLDMQPNAAGGNPITVSQFSIRTQEHSDTALHLIERAVTAAGYSPQSFGLSIEGLAQSGTALRLRERKTFITQQKKLQYWQSPLEDILYLALLIDKSVFQTQIEVFRPKVELADSVMPDPQETATTIELLNRAQAISLETRVRMAHPDWDANDVNAEVERLRDELGMRVIDPTKVGVPPGGDQGGDGSGGDGGGTGGQSGDGGGEGGAGYGG